MRIFGLFASLACGVVARVGWSRVGMAGSLMLLAAALVALCGMLRDIDLDQILAAVRATPLHAALGACGLVFIGYGTLTFYDYFALRAVGRR
jgi:glycosyltransferase 2 family protein